MVDFDYTVGPPHEKPTLEISWVNVPTTFFDLTISGVWFNADSGAVRFDEPVDFEPEGHC